MAFSSLLNSRYSVLYRGERERKKIADILHILSLKSTQSYHFLVNVNYRDSFFFHKRSYQLFVRLYHSGRDWLYLDTGDDNKDNADDIFSAMYSSVWYAENVREEIDMRGLLRNWVDATLGEIRILYEMM